MPRPHRNAPTSEWTVWADKHYPFDGRSAKRAQGFDLVRTVEDPILRGDMARALAESIKDTTAHPAGVPPMPDFGYGNLPKQGTFDDLIDSRMPPERDE